MIKKAFTIVELLVVMAVIGILIAMSVIGIQAIQTGSRETQRGNDTRNLQGLMEEYYAKFKLYPRPHFNNQREFRVDGGWDTGIEVTTVCLMVPGTANGSGCTSSSVEGGNYFRVYTLGNKGSRFVTSVTFAGSYMTQATTHCNANNNPPSYSNWFVYYSIDATISSPQAYRLGRCSEYGVSTPLGSKLD